MIVYSRFCSDFVVDGEKVVESIASEILSTYAHNLWEQDVISLFVIIIHLDNIKQNYVSNFFNYMNQRYSYYYSATTSTSYEFGHFQFLVFFLFVAKPGGPPQNPGASPEIKVSWLKLFIVVA